MAATVMTRADSSGSGVPTIEADPFSRTVLADPEPLHNRLRDAGPLVYLSRYGVFGAARYAEVRGVLRNWQDFGSGAGVGLSVIPPDASEPPASVLLEADPPLHDAPRHVLSTLLLPRAIRRLRQSWTAVAADLVEEVLRQGTAFDAISALAREYPLRVFPDAIGVGTDAKENLIDYGDLLFNAFGPDSERTVGESDRIAKLSEWIKGRCDRSALAPGSIGERIWQAADRGDITHAQAPLVVRPLLSAGVDTTVHALGAVLYAFATHPRQWRRLVGNPGLAHLAFDEAVRWESPVQTFFRTAGGHAAIDGVPIPVGSKVLLFLGAANRDPRRWDDPGTFDLDRDPSGHVAFGCGIHECVGQHIARLESQCLLSALAARVKTIHLAGPPVRHLNNTLRGWESMPVRVEIG
jgi:4-methoxybenzoate monooxygenase (O-demethylating)